MNAQANATTSLPCTFAHWRTIYKLMLFYTLSLRCCVHAIVVHTYNSKNTCNYNWTWFWLSECCCCCCYRLSCCCCRFCRLVVILFAHCLLFMRTTIANLFAECFKCSILMLFTISNYLKLLALDWCGADVNLYSMLFVLKQVFGELIYINVVPIWNFQFWLWLYLFISRERNLLN